MINQIICAAIKLPDDLIFRGHRHYNCIDLVSKMEKYKGLRVTSDMQGFITSENKFVGRVEALNIQIEAKIPSKRGKYSNKLYSEDLY